MNSDMYYWYGWRVFDKKIDTEPTKKILSIPHSTYEEAKIDREELKAEDIEITDIFEADSRKMAEDKMALAEFKCF